MPHAPLRLSEQAQRTKEQPISHFMKQAIETPGLISLAAGLVDEPSLPTAEIAAAVKAVLADPATAKAALQYGTTQGLASLRQTILARYAADDGLPADSLPMTADDVLMTNGSQQLLYILSEALLDPGDIVITEAPSYFAYHSVLVSLGAEVIGVPMDEHGMRTDHLETLLLRLEQSGRLGRVKIIYTVDYFQNPTGLSLSSDRRRQLLELVRRFSQRQRILILEDAAYRELRFDGMDVRSVKCLDTTNEYVAYTSTFSKPCSPGIRVGYGLLPRDLMKPTLRIKGNHDFGSANLNQYIAHQMLTDGSYDRHVLALRLAYRTKRDAMVEALDAAFREWPTVKWIVPSGGMYCWLRFPEAVPTGPGSSLMEDSLREGVMYVPGEFCHVPDAAGCLQKNEIRLCYGVATVAQIKEGVRRLAKAAKRLAALQETVEEPAELAAV